MKRILFLLDVSLKNPTRGTPLRIYHFLEQLRKSHELYVCCQDVPSEYESVFVPYPTGSYFKKLLFLFRLIKEKKINLIFSATETGIKWPVVLKILTGLPIVLDIHSLAVEEWCLAGKVPAYRKFIWDQQIKFFLRFYNRAFACSQSLKRYYGRFGRKKIEIVYGGVDLKEFPVVQPIPHAEFVIGYMGNAHAYQGLDYLFEAASILRKRRVFDFRLMLILSNDREIIEKRLQELDLLSITDIYFRVPHVEVNSKIAQADVLIIPRPSIPVTEYAYPSKLPEYLLTQVPVIITDVGPVRELLSGRNVSVIIPSSDIARNLADELIKLKGMSSEERKLLGQRARAFVEAELTWDILGLKINAVIEKL